MELLVDTEAVQEALEEIQVLQEASGEELEVQADMVDKVQEAKQGEQEDSVVLAVLVVLVVQVEAMETRKEQNTENNARNSFNLQNMFLALMIHCRDSVSVPAYGDSPTSSSFEILGDIYIYLCINHFYIFVHGAHLNELYNIAFFNLNCLVTHK